MLSVPYFLLFSNYTALQSDCEQNWAETGRRTLSALALFCCKFGLKMLTVPYFCIYANEQCDCEQNWAKTGHFMSWPPAAKHLAALASVLKLPYTTQYIVFVFVNVWNSIFAYTTYITYCISVCLCVWNCIHGGFSTLRRTLCCTESHQF